MISFFFSSRRRHTRCGRDWSSDVCSSDLAQAPAGDQQAFRLRRLGTDLVAERDDILLALAAGIAEAEETESLERQHLEAVRGEKASQPVVHLIRIGRADGDPARTDALEP